MCGSVIPQRSLDISTLKKILMTSCPTLQTSGREDILIQQVNLLNMWMSLANQTDPPAKFGKQIEQNQSSACVLSHVWLCDPMNYIPPGSSAHGIFQARILEWVAVSFSRGSSWSRDQTRVSWVSCIAWFFTAEPLGKPNQSSTMKTNHFTWMNTIYQKYWPHSYLFIFSWFICTFY